MILFKFERFADGVYAAQRTWEMQGKETISRKFLVLTSNGHICIARTENEDPHTESIFRGVLTEQGVNFHEEEILKTVMRGLLCPHCEVDVDAEKRGKHYFCPECDGQLTVTRRYRSAHDQVTMVEIEEHILSPSAGDAVI